MIQFEISLRTYRGAPLTVARKVTSRDWAARREIAELAALEQAAALAVLAAPDDELDDQCSLTHGSELSQAAITAESPTLSPSVVQPPVLRLLTSEAKALRESGFCSVGFYGPTKPVPRALGDTVGCRPIHPSLSATWKPALIAQVDRLAPFTHHGLLLRIWFVNEAEAERFYKELPRFLSAKGGSLRDQWFDVGAETDLGALKSEVLALAAQHGLKTFADHEVLHIVRQHADKSQLH
jgi:hypothetical protein